MYLWYIFIFKCCYICLGENLSNYFLKKNNNNIYLNKIKKLKFINVKVKL